MLMGCHDRPTRAADVVMARQGNSTMAAWLALKPPGPGQPPWQAPETSWRLCRAYRPSEGRSGRAGPATRGPAGRDGGRCAAVLINVVALPKVVVGQLPDLGGWDRYTL
jgi:hypothetical protein